MAERINLWQHYPGIGDDTLLAEFYTHEEVLPSLRNNYIPKGDVFFESTDPDEGTWYFDAFCNQSALDFFETGEFSAVDLATISQHIWNGNLHFDSDGMPPFC